MKILICEDENVLAEVLQEKFRNEKFDVEIAKDGGEVIPKAKKFKPDVIILDILLPKMGGVDVLTDLKADEDLKNIPVIALSNLSEDKMIKEVLVLGALEYLIKTEHPINEVVEIVNKYILKAR
jgi:DNA-binding response OmpR family regulator